MTPLGVHGTRSGTVAAFLKSSPALYEWNLHATPRHAAVSAKATRNMAAPGHGPVDVLLRVNGVGDEAVVNGRRRVKRHLHEDAVHAKVVVERAQLGQQLHTNTRTRARGKGTGRA